MGTHPIFESDFDCLTDMLSIAQEAFTWVNDYMSRWYYIDYHGQWMAEKIFQVILVVSGVIGFIYGFLTESMQNSMMCLGAGFALSCVLTVLPWPYLRPQTKDLKWADECDEDDDRLYPSWHKRD